MPVGDIMKVRFVCLFADQVGINVRHYRVTAETIPVPDLGDIATHFSLGFNNLYKNLLSAEANFRGVGVQKIFPLPLSVEVATVTNAGPGLETGDPLPGAVSGLIALTTDFGGRRGRGRSYIPFPAEAVNDDNGAPTVIYQGNLTVLGNTLTGVRTIPVGGGSIELTPVIFNRMTPGSSLNVTGAIARTQWATQRRRSRQGGGDTPPF